MATIVLDPAVHCTASVPRTSRFMNRKQYKDKQFKGGEAGWKEKLEKSSTVYVGNLSCYTNEYQLHELFRRCGGIKRIIMGLDKFKKTPCGFCFVEFDDRESALKSISYLNRTHLDGREIHIDMDAGFVEGRQFGRGTTGGQIGDEKRRDLESRLGNPADRRASGGLPGQNILTRSITVMACLAMISIILVAYHPEPVSSDIVIRPYALNRYQYNLSPAYIRKHQVGQQRDQFEKAIAQVLVNIMKTAKPTLLKAFIAATLADKQLKEIALSMFFNNTNTDNDDV